MTTPRFEPADVSDELPVPGFYPSTITAARIRRGQSGNRIVPYDAGAQPTTA